MFAVSQHNCLIIRVCTVTSTQKYPEIKRFVQEILGCSCPEEVFNHIDCRKEDHGIPERRIHVGGRLLIYFISTDGKPDLQGLIGSALEQGVEERDHNGFSRFRLVLVSSHPEKVRSSSEHAFSISPYKDDKTYLHVVTDSDVASFW